MIMKDEKESYQLRDKVCVAYCDQYGNNKEIKPGVITDIIQEFSYTIIEIMVINPSGATSTIRERSDSIRVMPISKVVDLLDTIAEKVETKIKKNLKGKK